MYSDNLTQKVAQAAAKIMDEELKGKQHKIDANKNGKVDAHDFKLLRAKKEVKEESEQIDELSKATMGSYVNKSAKDAVDRTAQEVETGEIDKLADKRMKGIKLATKKLAKEETDQVEEGYFKNIDTNRKEDERLAKKDSSPFGKPDKKKNKIATPGKFGYGYSAARHLARQGMASMTKEESEQVDEVIQKTSSGYIHHARPGVYGGSEKEKHVVDTLRGPKKSELNAIEKEKKMKKSFSEMVELYNEIGLKSLSNMISEEPDNEQFTQELKDQQAKSEGKGKKAEVAKGAVQAVKVEEGVLKPELEKGFPAPGVKTGASAPKGTTYMPKKNVKEEAEQVEERSLTEPEMEKKEEIVKSMKKGLSGFKDRYGDRAKEVMYATATARAKGE